jgi:hypothetical protein
MNKVEFTEHQAQMLAKGPWNPEDRVAIVSISQDGQDLVVEFEHHCVGRWTRVIPPGRPLRTTEVYAGPVVVHVKSGKVHHPQCSSCPVGNHMKEYPDKPAAAAAGYTDECKNCFQLLNYQPIPEMELVGNDFPASPWWSYARSKDEREQLVQRLEQELAEMIEKRKNMKKQSDQGGWNDNYWRGLAISGMRDFLRQLKRKRVPRVLRWRHLWVCMER